MRLTHFPRGTRTILAGCVLFLSGVLPAQKGFKQALPADTMFYFAAPDLPAACEQFKQSALYQIWQEEEVQDFLADLIEEVKGRVEQGLAQARAMHEQGMVPVSPDTVLAIRVRGIAAALTRVQLPGPDSPPKAGFYVCVDFGDSVKKVQELLAMVPQMLAGQAAPMAPKHQERDVAGTKVHTLWSPAMGASSINYAFAGSRLLFGTDKDEFDGIFTKLVQGGGGGLATDPAYRSAAKKVGAADAVLEGFFRFGSVVDLGLAALKLAAQFEPELQDWDLDRIEEIVDFVGLKSFKTIAFASGWENGEGWTNLFIAAPKAERKGLAALGSSQDAVDLDLLKLVPKDVASAQLGRWSPVRKSYDLILATIDRVDPDKGKEVRQAIAGVEGDLGFNIADDLIGGFGPDLLFWQMPVAGMSGPPEMTFVLGCQKPERTLEVLRKLASLTQGAVEITDQDTQDGKIHPIDIVLDTGGMDVSAFLDPAIAFKDGKMILSLTRQDVRAALRRMSGQGGASVLDNEAFKKLRARVPDKVTSFNFQDVAAAVDGLYGMVSGALAFVTLPPEVPLDLSLLPSAEAITNHLGGAISYWTVDDAGLNMKSFGSLQGPEQMALVAGLGIGAAALFATRGKMRVRRAGGFAPKKKRGEEPAGTAPGPLPAGELIPAGSGSR